MQQLTHLFESKNALLAFIAQHRLTDRRGLVHVFSGKRDVETGLLIQWLKRNVPNFALIGASTYGEIVTGQCRTESLVLQFCVFEKNTTTQVVTIDPASPIAEQPKVAAGLQRQPKLIILFANAFRSNPDDIIEQLSFHSPGCAVVGGIAADNGAFCSAYLLIEDELKTDGVVCAFVYGEQLNFAIKSYQGWRPIGKKFVVTKAQGNHVYELDNRPIIDVYKEYIGEHAAIQFPRNVVEFPLMLRQGSRSILRAPIAFTDCQQGIKYAGALKEGQQVSFSFADVSAVLASAPEFKAQAGVFTLVYSCAARRLFLKGRITEEVERLSKHTGAAGGFFYGEFSTVDKRPKLLNLSTTVLQLSESCKTFEASRKSAPQQSLPNSTQSLANLASKASMEHEALLFSLQQHQHALSSSAIISITNAAGIITYVNRKFEQISGYRSDELLGNTHRLIRHPKMKGKVFEQLWATITRKKRWQGLLRNRRKDGSSYYVKTVIYPVTDERGNITEYVSIRNDVTDIITARQAIQKQNTDTLTQLPNRSKLSRDLERTPVDCVAIFDVKNFKVLNDYWGIEHGDSIIKAVAQRLRSNNLIYGLKTYHINGAVFAVRPIKPESMQLFNSKITRIKKAAESSDIVVSDHHHELNFSVGIGHSAKRALAYAESAVSEAKQEHFVTSIITRTEDAQTDNFYFWLEETKLALLENRVIPYFQEVVTIAENSPEYTKYEALARIRLRNGDIASPGQFLNYLKKTRYYTQLTRRMVDFAIQQSLSSACWISVNLATQDILDKETVNYIVTALERHRNAQIIFEITESESIKDFNAMDNFIRQVRRLEAKIAIDDFGSGYSNFVYLAEMKPDYIKIDGSIIKSICTNENSLHVARSIIDMATNLKIKTIAEFVGDAKTLEKLKSLGAECAQGYFIAKPRAMITAA